jgi:hypothetical protein
MVAVNARKRQRVAYCTQRRPRTDAAPAAMSSGRARLGHLLRIAPYQGLPRVEASLCRNMLSGAVADT